MGHYSQNQKQLKKVVPNFWWELLKITFASFISNFWDVWFHSKHHQPTNSAFNLLVKLIYFFNIHK